MPHKRLSATLATALLLYANPALSAPDLLIKPDDLSLTGANELFYCSFRGYGTKENVLTSYAVFGDGHVEDEFKVTYHVLANNHAFLVFAQSGAGTHDITGAENQSASVLSIDRRTLAFTTNAVQFGSEAPADRRGSCQTVPITLVNDGAPQRAPS